MIKKIDPIEFLEESNAIENVFDELSLNQALYAWNYLIDHDELTIGVICKTHKILMNNQPLRPNERGYFRTIPVYIGGHTAFPYQLIHQAVDEWCIDAMTSVKVPGISGENIKFDHVQYETIHPFVDGNGRTGRMFMNWQRVKAGLPILVIKASERREYYKWFNQGKK